MKKNYIATLNNRIIQDAMSADELMLVRGGQTTNIVCPTNEDCPVNLNLKCPVNNCINTISCLGTDKRCTSPNEVCPITDINTIGSCD